MREIHTLVCRMNRVIFFQNLFVLPLGRAHPPSTGVMKTRPGAQIMELVSGIYGIDQNL